MTDELAPVRLPALEALPPELPGLNIDMLDADRLRLWASRLEEYGPNVTEWGSVAFVINEMRRVAQGIEAEVRAVGELRVALAALRGTPMQNTDEEPADTGPLPIEATLRAWETEVKYYESQSGETHELMARTLRTCVGQIRRSYEAERAALRGAAIKENRPISLADAVSLKSGEAAIAEVERLRALLAAGATPAPAPPEPK